MIQPVVTCLDLEGVLVPEIWLAVADQMGVSELTITTREVPDYDELMKRRLAILDDRKISLKDIEAVIAGMSPLPGASDFLFWLRERSQVIILSDTYYELAGPLMKQLQYPTLFSHNLEVDAQGFICNYHLRQQDQKRHAVAALKGLNFRVLAAGDSYNDISMLSEAHAGILFRPPNSFGTEFPQFPICQTYEELQAQLGQQGPLRP
jgi:phosphoserine/homoserine phosphotransferase